MAIRPTSKDTIYALSSGRLPAAIAVVRVSGPRAGEATSALAGSLPEPRRAALRTLRDPSTREALDQGLVLWFPGPASETGEDIAEFQVHGGPAVVSALFRVLGSLDGLRPAEPGEFTRRAFENERVDLTRVEALADLVAASTEAQRRQALGQLQGLLGDRASGWRARLIGAMAQVEAGLDFADEPDIPAATAGRARESARALRNEIAAVLEDRRGERLRDGLVVAIAGPPNAGKSTLLNRIAGREAALVSPAEGTTRDVIEVHLDLCGTPITLLDTAGLREARDAVEQAGVARALQRAKEADLVLWVSDCRAAAEARPVRFNTAAPVWGLENKVDLIDSAPKQTRIEGIRRISAQTGAGIGELLDDLQAFASASIGAAEPALVTRARHREALTDVVDALDRALVPDLPEEVFAEELRAGASGLGRLLGQIDVEDVLDSVFRDFCIGK